jgi:hypothetical protein
MQLVIGCVLLVLCFGMLMIARPAAGQDSVIWLSKPWILGQIYVLAALATAVVGVSTILNGLPS